MTEPPTSGSPGDNEPSGEQPDYATPAEHEAEGAVGEDEFFDTDWDQIDADDALIDAIGTGADVTMPSLLDQVVADTLAGDRDRTRNAELPDKTHPDNVIDEKRRRDEQTAAAQRSRGNNDTGDANSMATNEELAAQVAALGSSDNLRAASAALSQADIELGQLGELVASVLTDGPSAQAIQGAINQVRQGIAELTGPLMGIPAAFEEAAGKLRGV